MSEPESITVSAQGEPVTIFESTSEIFYILECDVCRQEKRTLDVGEVHSYNRIEICLDCLRQAIAKTHDVVTSTGRGIRPASD